MFRVRHRKETRSTLRYDGNDDQPGGNQKHRFQHGGSRHADDIDDEKDRALEPLCSSSPKLRSEVIVFISALGDIIIIMHTHTLTHARTHTSQHYKKNTRIHY